MLPDIQPGNTKILYFFNCLLDGMHTIDAMKNELETTFHDAYKAGKVYLMAASSSSEEVTKEWVEQVKEAFPGMEVMSDYLSFGLSCHIGPDGLGIGCTCKPV